MPIQLRQKGKHMVQVAVFEKKSVRSGKIYVELDWSGINLKAGKEPVGATYRIQVREPIYDKESGEFRGQFHEFTFQKTYDRAQRLDEIFWDFFEEHPEANSDGSTIKYSFTQWVKKHEAGEMEGWVGFILPPVRM